MKTTIRLTLAALALMGCSGEISLENADVALDELNAGVASFADIAEAMDRAEAIRQRPVDQAGRDSAQALADEVAALHEELVAIRREEHEEAAEGEKEYLATVVERAVNDAAREQAELETLIESGTVGDIKLAIDLALMEAQSVRGGIDLATYDPNPFLRLGVGRERSDTPQLEPPPAESSPEPRQPDEPATPPDPEPVTEPVAPEPEPDPAPAEPTPEEIREAAAAAVDDLEPLYDELVELLEAIEEAHTDAEAKRQAGQRVTMAGVARGQEMERLRQDVAAEEMYRVTGAERTVGRIRARLEAEIEEARELLRELGGG